MYNISIQHHDITDDSVVSSATHALVVEAFNRGHKVWTHTPQDLSMDHDTLVVKARQLMLGENNTLVAGKRERKEAQEFDIIMMRARPPVDMEYITACHLLETIHPHTLVVNSPASVRRFSDKMMAFEFSDLMPPTLITSDMGQIRDFRQEYEDIVIKPLYESGGRGLLRITPRSNNLSSLVEMFEKGYPMPWMVQQYVPAVEETGHKQIFLTQTEILCAFSRRATGKTIRANLSAGAEPQEATVSASEKEIADRVMAFMKKHGIVYAGMNMIGPYLTEINTTTPSAPNMGTESKIWEAIEAEFTRTRPLAKAA